MYRYCNTFDVRHYSSIIYAKLWPEIEKEILLSWSDAVLNDDAEHQVPHDCGGPWGDPYFVWDDYGTNQKHWKDLHSKFIQQIWRYYYLYKDKEFLQYAWDACKATYGYMKKTDTDGDGLPNNSGSDNTYDAWGLWGTSLLCGGLWVGALEAMEQIATILNDPILDEVKELLVKARKNLDEKLWHAKGGYYKIDTESKFPTAIMADGLNGQRYCECYGLEDILPKEKLVSHLKQVFARNVVPLKDFNGDGVGDCGAINGIREDGGYIGSQEQAEEIWTGSSYYLSASMYHAGLKEEALKTAFGVYYITYEEETTAYWFNTPEAWRDGGIHPRPTHPEQYQRPRAVWELVFEINDPYKK
jgi:non-lysosomal glucosylceramidase